MNAARRIVSGAVSLARGLGATISYLFRKKVTLMYPGERPVRRLGDFTLDVAGCIFCGLYAEVCPTGALTMSGEFELAHGSRVDMVLGLEKLREIGGQFPLEAPDSGTAEGEADQGAAAPPAESPSGGSGAGSKEAQ